MVTRKAKPIAQIVKNNKNDRFFGSQFVGEEPFFRAATIQPKLKLKTDFASRKAPPVRKFASARQSVTGIQLQGSARRRQQVTLASNCTNGIEVARAIPGAKAMTWRAITWLISFNPRNRARINQLLRINFRSDTTSVFDQVKNRVLAIHNYLDRAQNGNLNFTCEPANHIECTRGLGRPGFVLTRDRNTIHLCPSFFRQTLEERRWMLIHECAHLAGAMGHPEQYIASFGTVDCTGNTPSGDVNTALGNADNYARFIWCLTRRANTQINTP